jgi:hypothetical protein
MIRRASSPRPRLERPADVFLDLRSMPITALALIGPRAAQAIRRSYDLGWTADRYVTAVSESIATVLEPAGLEKAKGLITGAYNEDVTDGRWKRGAAERQQRSFVIILMPRQLSCPFALLTV